MRRLLLPLLLSLAPLGAHSAVVQRYDLAALTRTAQRVALVQVDTVSARWVGGRIITRVRVVPQSTLKGGAETPFELQVMGGEVDGLAQRVSGAAAFQPGEWALVFAGPARDGVHRLVGMAQGKLAVTFDARGLGFVSDLSGLKTAVRGEDGEWTVTPPALAPRVSLGALLADVNQALQAQP